MLSTVEFFTITFSFFLFFESLLVTLFKLLLLSSAKRFVANKIVLGSNVFLAIEVFKSILSSICLSSSCMTLDVTLPTFVLTSDKSALTSCITFINSLISMFPSSFKALFDCLEYVEMTDKSSSNSSFFSYT